MSGATNIRRAERTPTSNNHVAEHDGAQRASRGWFQAMSGATNIRRAERAPTSNNHHSRRLRSSRFIAPNGTSIAACLPLLDSDDRACLIGALERAHPGHAWLAALGGR
jgi:hypothetical protein